jgi:hypothetical protein
LKKSPSRANFFTCREKEKRKNSFIHSFNHIQINLVLLNLA